MGKHSKKKQMRMNRYGFPKKAKMKKNGNQMQLTKAGFPKKIKIVNPKPGRPKKPHRLMKEKEYYAFIEWAAKPSPLKGERTQEEFSKKWNVRPATISKWKRRQDFWERVAQQRIEWAKDKTSDVIHGLFKRASSRGEAAEVKLWMELIEDWSEKAPPPSPNITIIGIRGISDDKLQKLVKPPENVRIQEGEVIEN